MKNQTVLEEYLKTDSTTRLTYQKEEKVIIKTFEAEERKTHDGGVLHY